MRIGFSVNDKIKKNCKVKIEFENGYGKKLNYWYFFFLTSLSSPSLKEIERTRNFEKKNSLKIYFKGKYLEKFEKGNMKDSQKILEEELM